MVSPSASLGNTTICVASVASVARSRGHSNYQVRLRGQISDWFPCNRGMVLGYSAILPLRVAPSVSSPTGPVRGVPCRFHACKRARACSAVHASGGSRLCTRKNKLHAYIDYIQCIRIDGAVLSMR